MRNLLAVAVLVLASVAAFAAADPCSSPDVAKKHAFANITIATTTSLVAVPSNPAQSIFVCALVAQISGTGATPDTVLFESGTGASCSSPTAVTATYTNGGTAASPFTAFVEVATGQNVLTVALGSGLCALSTAASSGTAIAVDVTYVLQ